MPVLLWDDWLPLQPLVGVLGVPFEGRGLDGGSTGILIRTEEALGELLDRAVIQTSLLVARGDGGHVGPTQRDRVALLGVSEVVVGLMILANRIVEVVLDVEPRQLLGRLAVDLRTRIGND
jgi:hypothetical protein